MLCKLCKLLEIHIEQADWHTWPFLELLMQLKTNVNIKVLKFLLNNTPINLQEPFLMFNNVQKLLETRCGGTDRSKHWPTDMRAYRPIHILILLLSEMARNINNLTASKGQTLSVTTQCYSSQSNESVDQPKGWIIDHSKFAGLIVKGWGLDWVDWRNILDRVFSFLIIF